MSAVSEPVTCTGVEGIVDRDAEEGCPSPSISVFLYLQQGKNFLGVKEQLKVTEQSQSQGKLNTNAFFLSEWHSVHDVSFSRQGLGTQQ